jgi:two-component system KDP operon response regulator KdpE
MNTTKILLIADEPNLLRTLRRNLLERGYEVAIALDDQETLTIVAQSKPDLCILSLDFTTVQVNGLEICEELRKVTPCPIIVLSAIGSQGAKIRALDLGADDYMVMPFGMEEFLARVRSALRRWTATKSEAIHQEHLILHGDLFINTDSREVRLRGELIHLTPREFDLLVYLAGRPGKVVSHGEILRGVWGNAYGGEREYLRVFVSQIRRKIEDDPLRPRYLLTEPGIGYRFASDS